MDGRETGKLLARLRRERGMTQRRVAEELHVSAQAVSKWERCLGCPDVSLLAALSGMFGVSVERLLAGDLAQEEADGGNMKRLKFYVCPDCGNIMTATGGGEPHCCGRKLYLCCSRDGLFEVKLVNIDEPDAKASGSFPVHRSSGRLPVSLFTIFFGPQRASPR